MKFNLNPFGKLCAGFILLLLPIILLFVGLNYFKQREADILTHYRFPKNLNMGNSSKFMKHMKRDKEFKLYYQILSRDQIKEAFEELSRIVARTKNKTQIREEITKRQTKVDDLANHLNHFNLSEEKGIPGQSPNDPNLKQKLIENFVSDEFKLTLLSLYYKSNSDPEFKLQWQDPTKEAAARLIQEMNQLH